MLDFYWSKDKKIVLLFSGGYDSTMLLVNLLEYKCKDITLFYINIPNNKKKSCIEQKRCVKILKTLNKKYNRNLTFTVIKSTTLFNTKGVYWQPYLFITTMIPYIDDNVDYILFGYHRVSSIWHCYDSFVGSFNTLMRLKYCYRKDDVSTPSIYIPYEFQYKYDIVDWLKKTSKRVFKQCWTCENPTKKGKKCGKCLPCVKFKEVKEKMK